jgi:dienelactone hydrolase
MTLRRSLCTVAAAWLCVVAAGCASVGERGRGAAAPAAAGLQGTKPDGSESWLIPSPVPGVLMRATLHRPPGSGPFPLAVVNHGSEQDPARRVAMPDPSFPPMTAWLLARGYAVLVPQRPGHGATGGRYLEDQGPCGGADYAAAGNAVADSIAAAVSAMRAQPFIAADGVVVVGNSAGGWGALAYAARNPDGVSGVVAFAAGRGGRDRDVPGRNCSPDRLIAAAGAFGRTARVPVLLLYAENDTYFPPALSARIAEAYRASGGNLRYELLPPAGTEGHALIDAPAAVWGAPVGDFLSRLQ